MIEIALKPFEPRAICVKCSSQMIRVQYKEHIDGEGHKREVMIRQCDTCGFIWNEAPLDQNPERLARVIGQ